MKAGGEVAHAAAASYPPPQGKEGKGKDEGESYALPQLVSAELGPVSDETALLIASRVQQGGSPPSSREGGNSFDSPGSAATGRSDCAGDGSHPARQACATVSPSEAAPTEAAPSTTMTAPNGRPDTIHHILIPPLGFHKLTARHSKDHRYEAEPRVACNCDAVRCELVCPPHMARPCFELLSERLCQPSGVSSSQGGGVIARVKNTFQLSDAQVSSSPTELLGGGAGTGGTANTCPHFRSVTANYGVRFHEVTHGALALALLEEAETQFPFGEERAACRVVASCLNSTNSSALLPVGMVCEVEIMLPEYAAGRQMSLWPTQVFGAGSSAALADLCQGVH